MAKRIPRFEPEIVAAVANRCWQGDDEKVATTSVGEIAHRGITVTSRYSKAHEMDVMLNVVEALTATTRQRIESIFCDSKAAAVYEVKLRRPINPTAAKLLGQEVGAACRLIAGGHNGIYVSNGQSCDIEIPPDWGEE